MGVKENEQIEHKSEFDKFLDDTYGTEIQVPVAVKGKKPATKSLSKIEKAGKDCMAYLMELAQTTQMPYSAMAKELNKEFNIDVTKHNIYYFFHTNHQAILKLQNQQKAISKIRSNLIVEYHSAFTKDMLRLDQEIDNLSDGIACELMEPDKKAKAIGDLIDKKGRLLLRYARLSGKLDVEKADRGTKIDNLQINILQKIESEKSDIINRLKKAEFKEEVIDVPLEQK